MPLHGPDKSVPEIVNSAPFLPFPLFHLLLLGWMDTGADAPTCEKHRWFSGAVFPIKSRSSLSPNTLVPSQSQMLNLLHLREGKKLLPKMGMGDWLCPHLCAPLLPTREPFPPLSFGMFQWSYTILPCPESHSDISHDGVYLFLLYPLIFYLLFLICINIIVTQHLQPALQHVWGLADVQQSCKTFLLQFRSH